MGESSFDFWHLPLESFAALTLLMIGTYATRVLGYLVVSRFNLGDRLDRFLHHVPGAVFAALVAPMVVRGTPVEWAAAGVALVVMLYSKSLPLAILGGVICAAAVRWSGLA